MRFWIRLLSSGSVTSVQSTSLELAFAGDFLEDDPEGCFFDVLWEPGLIMLFGAIFSSRSFVLELAVSADFFRVWLDVVEAAVPNLVERVLERVESSSARESRFKDLGLC